MVRTKISQAQFFVSMFVSHILVTIALNAKYTGGESILDNIVSYAIAMIAAVIIALPIWLCQKRGTVPELAVLKRLPWTALTVWETPEWTELAVWTPSDWAELAVCMAEVAVWLCAVWRLAV